MAEGKKTFIFYSDWINMVREMPNNEAGELLKHILAYVNDENPETDNMLVKIVFAHMKPILKADLKKWDNIREKRSLAGSKGGKANAKQKKANAKQLEAVNDNVNVNVNVKEGKKSIEVRKSAFYKSLTPYVDEYGKDMIRAFFDYWSEHNENGRKMKFEMNKTFSIPYRLRTWKGRQNDFSKKSTTQQTEVKKYKDI